MNTDRRDFLGKMAAGAMFGALPLGVGPTGFLEAALATSAPPGPWDVSWPQKLTGKKKVVFDVPEVELGYGVWRASIWPLQYQNVLDVPAKDMSVVLVLRHNAIILAMQQAFWDAYNVGEEKKVLHPVTEQPTKKNPALMSSAAGDLPAQFDDFALPRLIARGGVVLACDLALQDVIRTIQAKENLSPEAARTKAIDWLVPGVVLQPSGVFAAIRAQEAGCMYLRAS